MKISWLGIFNFTYNIDKHYKPELVYDSILYLSGVKGVLQRSNSFYRKK